MILQFKNPNVKATFKKTLKELTGEAQNKFAREVKAIAEKKIVSDDDFTINLNDLRVALSK